MGKRAGLVLMMATALAWGGTAMAEDRAAEGNPGARAKTATQWGDLMVVGRVAKAFETAIGEAPPELKGKRPVVFEVVRKKGPGPRPPAMLESLGGEGKVATTFENVVGEALPELKEKKPVALAVDCGEDPGPWPPVMFEALGGRQEACIAAYRSEGVLHWVLYSTEQPPVLLGVFRKEGEDSPWIRCPDTVPQPDAVEEPQGNADGHRPPATAETP